MLIEQELTAKDHDRLPIPNQAPIEGWEEIPIKEYGEPLVSLQEYAPSVVLSPHYYYTRIPGSLEQMYVRKTVAYKLETAKYLLPEGYKIVVWDTWRPLEVQVHLFNEYKTRIMQEIVGLSDREYNLSTQKYVSCPSVDPNKPSPHLTGGAVDLTLQSPDGTLLSMGTQFDDFSPVAATRYFEYTESRKTGETATNRRLLYWIMHELGFTNYPEEWWHFDYGNQFYGRITNKPAVYGLIFP